MARHAAELTGQLPELLLRSPDKEAALRSWMADKDLSHWIPQSDGGTAAQRWQFETASQLEPLPRGCGDGAVGHRQCPSRWRYRCTAG